MTNEEWNRKAEFLLNQQAKFDADLQELKQEIKEAQKNNEKKISEAIEIAAHSAEASLHVAESVTKLAETVGNLATATHEGFRKVFDGMKRTDEKINVLIDSQIRSDERFERHLRENHGLSDA
jgi:polyhydroxyalkanoate synthesis regulator phasin